MPNEKAVGENNQNYDPLVSWFLNKKALFKRDGANGEFYQARVFKGTKLPDGKDISGYTYTFDLEKLKEIKVHENSPDFIKDDEFRKNNGVVYFKEETNIKLTEPYDKENPDKELETILVEAKVLSTALKNREKNSDSQEDGKDKSREKGTKERVTDRAVAASKAKSDSLDSKEVDFEKAV